MKKSIFILVIMVFTLIVNAQERWDVYTNTSFVYESELSDNSIIVGSWGGVEKYNIIENGDNISLELTDKYTIIDGLVSNEILTVAKHSDQIWVGSYNDGVSIIFDNDSIYNLNEDNGLLSNSIKSIVSTDDLFFVATASGITSYYTLDEVAFPILNRNYTFASTNGALPTDVILDMDIVDDNLIVATELGISWVAVDSVDANSAWNYVAKEELGLSEEIIHFSYNNKGLSVATSSMLSIINDFPNNIAPRIIDIAELYESEISSLSVTSQGDVLFSLGIWDNSLTTISNFGQSLYYKVNSSGNIDEMLTEGISIYNLNDDTSSALSIEYGIKDISLDGDRLVLSTWGNGIIIKNNQEWYSYTPDGIGFNAVSDLAVDNDNLLWVCCGYFGANPLRKGAKGVSSFDGSSWESFNIHNSPIHSDNITSIAVGTDNKKWFGAWSAGGSNPFNWRSGLTSYNQQTNEWVLYNSSAVYSYNEDNEDYTDLEAELDALNSSTIAQVRRDLKGNIMIAEQSGGIEFYNEDGSEKVASFLFSNSVSNYSRKAFNCEFGYFFSKSNSVAGDAAELYFWNSQDIPFANVFHWETIPSSELRLSQIYDFAEVKTPYETQVWIASSNGLYMYNGTYWYKYDNVIKRYRWEGSWVIDTRYFVGETKLFSANQTIPTALATDGYGCVWIGSEDYGLCKYDTDSENFYNYTQDNYPLLSNRISALEYEPLSGKIYIGSTEGLCSVTAGSIINNQKDFDDVVAYPNPFRPDQGDILKIINEPTEVMPSNTKTCKIYDISGQLVYELPRNKYQSFTWDGNNAKGKKCSSGIYFYTISDNKGQTKRGKIALIRGN